MASEDQRPHQDTAPIPPKPPRNLRRIAIAAVAAAVLIALFGIVQRRSHEAEVKQWTQEQAVPTVAVISPRQGALVQHLVLPGTVQAWYEAPIFARVSGYIKNWYFDYGARVKKGDLLAEIDAPDLDAQLAAAQAKLNSAKATVKVREAEKEFAETTFARWRDSPKGVVSEQEQQSKQADYNSAAARLNAAIAEVAADQGDVDRLQALEDYKRITAPFDGVVTARETDIGALINAGSGTGGGNGPELFRVADIHEMRVYVQVPQQLTAGIHAGLTADSASAATSGHDVQGDRRHDLKCHQPERTDPAGRAPCRQPGWPAAARRLRSGRFRVAGQSARGPAADQRADLPRERAGSGHHRPGQQN